MSNSLLTRLNPCKKDSPPPSPTRSGSFTSDVTSSKMASSCEIFNLFKTLAAGKPSPSRTSSQSDSPISTPSTSSDLTAVETELRALLNDPSTDPSPEPDSPSQSAEKVAAIQSEYGVLGEQEEMLVESEGTMYKGIMVIGNIHLTTHRLLFHALLPPDEAFVRKDFEALSSSPLHSSPVNWHRRNPLNPSQRVWMELSAESISMYASADESGRLRPIKSILLSSIDKLQPLDPAKPSDITLSHHVDDAPTKTLFFTVDTLEAAAQWRRQIEAALFRILRMKWRNDVLVRSGKEPESSIDRWDTLRFCVPLDRLTLTEIGDYHGFATLVGLRVNLDPSERVLVHSDLANDDHVHLEDPDHTFAFNLGVISNKERFVSRLTEAVKAASPTSGRLSFSIAGMNLLAGDDEIPDPLPAQTPESLPAKLARKATKAHLAAIALGLNEDEGIWIKRCYMDINSVPVRGHLVSTPRYVCFLRRNTIAQDIKYRFDTSLVKGFEPFSCAQPGFSGLALKLHGRHDVKFEFWNKDSRDQALAQLSQTIVPHSSEPTTPAPSEESHPADILAPSKSDLLTTRILPDDFLSHMPFIANKPWMSRTIGLSPRTFAMLTIGSRGDVQPYIALGIRLKRDGHRVVIVTHSEFKIWIEGYGLEHRQAGGDPTALMKLSAEHKMLSPGFFKESIGYFRQWLDDLLVDAWTACKDADVLIESPSAMAGIHIAEKLGIPYFRAFTMPWTRTTVYPQAFMVPATEMSGGYNYSSYVIYDNVIWQATAGQINRWRKTYLELPSTDMSALSPTKIPFLYNFSAAVVPRPLDWHSDIAITGYWVLEDSDTDWSPPAALEEFMSKAQADGKALVYIGFGSIVVPKPSEMTRNIIEAVEKADVRAIIAKGWSSRGSTEQPVRDSPACYMVDKVPHGWLFPKVQAALHHGGAGTVGASLRAGLPTLISPFFGDQYFWANRVTKLGVGLKLSSLRADDIASALVKATTDRIMTEKASRIGEAIRTESGVDNAVEAINYYIVRAGADRTKLSWAK